jgi:hypothetical protein
MRMSKNIDALGLLKGFGISLLQEIAERDVRSDIVIGGISSFLVGCVVWWLNLGTRDHLLELAAALALFWVIYVASCLLVRFVARRVLIWILGENND